ncbi:MAG: patatin-like phospholipase family protein [Tenacibaculum sp.]|nr:patatin-like phospholipase family protein [Tenacibaculum sp.]
MKKLLLLFFAFQIVYSQQTKNPKVGLVLSGGGAKGFAHVGVLKEIEKAGIQIDYIGGTSMGAIVGGLYASGYTANQIEEIIKESDFESLLKDNIPRKYKPFFKKKYKENSAITLPIKKGKIELPLGLSKGQNVLNLLTKLLSPVNQTKDFSKLPIPFFCIATDIETGEEIILDKGNLPIAIRASASFPSLLDPVEINGRWLIDGGVVNNFPVNRMKKKDVNIIIGVSVQGKLYKRKEITSAVSILQQIVNFQMYNETDSQVNNVSIYIEPKVLDYSVISFDKSKEILEAGITEAKKFTKEFEEIAKLQKRKKKKNGSTLSSKKIIIDKIRVEGNKNYTRGYILGTLHLKECDSVSYDDISKKIGILSATNNFKLIDYELNEEVENERELILKVLEEDYNSSISLGVHYDKLYRSGLLVNYNHKKLLFKNDELFLNLVLGDNIRYNLNYFVNNGFYLSYGVSSRFQSFSSNISFDLNNLNKINVDYKDFTNRIYAQTVLGKKLAFGFGIEHKKLNISSETSLVKGKEETLFENTNYISPYAFLSLDTFDKNMFPKKGFNIDINFTWYLLSDKNKKNEEIYNGVPFKSFSQIKGKFSIANTFFDRITLKITPEIGFTFGEEETQAFDYILGGYNKNYINNFTSFYGYDIAGLSNQSFLKSEFNIYCKIFNKNYISFIANYARIDNNFLKNLEILKDLKSGYAVGYGVETFLGPIELKYSWSPDHNKGFWYFNLGFWF